MTKRLIAGAGGSESSSSRTPYIAPDDLSSEQYATVIDLISEGEIEGLIDGYQSVFLDDTALQNPDGSYNFPGTSVDYRYGTQDQSYIPLSSDTEDEKVVNVRVDFGTPITRTITDTQTDAVRVSISIPKLEFYEANGDITGAQLSLAILLQFNGGGFTYVINDTINGRASTEYRKDYVINFGNIDPLFRINFPIDVRVERSSNNSNATIPELFNDLIWLSYTEITYGKLTYPNSVIVVSRFAASEFSGIPSRKYLIRGIKIKIPSNATVDQDNGRLVYTGIWNGTFGAAQWCSDPAWVLYDLLTAKRYGFGEHISESSLDKFSFYAASQYASELVPDGFGTFEPRFSCNVNIQGSEDAYKLINDLCSVFRAMPYWGAGSLSLSQDRPADPSYLFTLANVAEAGFSYAGSSLKTRPNVATVKYFDIELRDFAYEVAEDQDAVSKYGAVTADIEAFACTSRGQAKRLGEWLIYTDRYEGEVISFITSIDAGVIVRPGQIIGVMDPMRAGLRRGGRIVSATTTSLTVDDATDLPSVATGLISVILPDGTSEQRTVTSKSSAVIGVSPAFSQAPNPNSIWIYQSSDLLASIWRVIGIKEEDGINYSVTAIAHNPTKYSFIEQNTALQFRDITNLNEPAIAPTDLTAEEVLYDAGGKAESKIIASWQSVPGVKQYNFRWRLFPGNWTSVTVDRFDYEIAPSVPGVYEIEVFSLSATLRPSILPARLTFQAFGKTAPPADVTGLSLLAGDQLSGILIWDRAIELDVILGGKVLIRHSTKLTGATWEESQEIIAAAAGSETQRMVPILEGSYLVKFEDSSGNRSVNATLVVIDLPSPQPRFLVKSYAEDQETPPFNGNVTGMFYSAEYDGLIIDGGQLVDDMATDNDWDALPSIDSIGGINPSGEYEFGSTWNMGAVYDVNMRRRFVTRPLVVGSLVDDKQDNIDTWDLIDETTPDSTNAQMYVRATNDDPSGSPVWGEWNELINAIVQGRGFQFKMTAFTADPTVNIIIDELGAELELQQHAEQSVTLSSGAGAYAVVFDNAFYQAPSVGVTGFNMATGDFFTVTSVTRTGFTVEFKNSAGTSVNRNFTYTAVGYGREV
jgi:hypothetical protein